MGVRQGHGSSVHCPVAPAGTDVQHAGGGGLCKAPPVSAGPVRLPMLRWRTCKLLVVKYAAPCTPPSDRAGGAVFRGKTAPTASWGPSLAWTGSSPREQEPDRWGRRSTHRCGQEAGLCRKSARERGWDMVLGGEPGQTEAQGRGRATMSPEPRDQQELESQHHPP